MSSLPSETAPEDGGWEQTTKGVQLESHHFLRRPPPRTGAWSVQQRGCSLKAFTSLFTLPSPHLLPPLPEMVSRGGRWTPLNPPQRIRVQSAKFQSAEAEMGETTTRKP